MIFAWPLGLLALLAIPAIVAIHLFRRRFPARPVAGLFLWQIIRQRPEGGGRMSKLPITTSLLLECLAALALALILAGARISPTGVSEHLVVLLDDSASMAAVNAAGESARDRAVRRVLEEMERLGAAARVTLVQSGDRPSVLSGPAALAVEARSALDAWRPEAPHHSLALGIRLARELAGRTGRLLVMSDLPPDARGEVVFDNGLWASVGEALPNAGIIAAQRTLSAEEGRGAVALSIANHSDSPVRRQLNVLAGEKNVLTREVDLPAGTSSLTLALPPGLPVVRVALSDDGLARDNAVILAEPRPRIVGVENHLADGRGRDALEKALGAVTGVTQAESGHLAFIDAATIERPLAGSVWRVGFGQAPASWTAPGEPGDFIGPFVIEKRHPLLLGATLDGVVWTGAMPLSAEAARPLASAGDRPLIAVSATAAAEPSILFNLDLERTNLIRAPDWPILISNIVEMRRRSLPGPERWNYRVGEWVRVHLDRAPNGPLRLRAGSVDRALPSGRLLEFLAPSPGGVLQIIEAGEGPGDDVVLYELGVNFLDETETDLRKQKTAETGQLASAADFRAESGPASDPLFWILLTIGGAAIVANWCLLSSTRGSPGFRSGSFPGISGQSAHARGRDERSGAGAPRARSRGLGRSPI